MKTIQLFVPLLLLSFLVACERMDPAEPGNLVPKTVDEDITLPHLDINGTRLHLETYGERTNPAIIFLHGGPGGDYCSLLKLKERYDGYSLSDEYFLVFYDQRGSGLSRRYGTVDKIFGEELIQELSFDTLLTDLKAIADYFSPNEKIILFGHSWGGTHAAQFINAFPERVAAAILSEPGYFREKDIKTSKGPGLLSETVNDIIWRTEFISTNEHERLDYFLQSSFFDTGAEPEYHFNTDEGAIQFFRYGALAALNSTAAYKGWDITTNLHHFQNKVLFINGSLNELLSPEFQKEVNMPRFSFAEIKIIDGVGHDLIWQKTEEHVKIIRDYLNNEIKQ